MTLSDGYKAITEPWASSPTADRTAPDDSSLDPPVVVAEGWSDGFSSDNAGAGAAGTATVAGGAVTTVAVTVGGTDYAQDPNQTPPSVIFTGGGGSGAIATATVNTAGEVTAVTVNDGGTGYTSVPTISFRVGLTPRRTVFNEMYYRRDSALIDIRGFGVLPWDTDVDTLEGGVKQVNGVLYRADVDNGPAYGNATDPTASGQSVWDTITGSLNAPNPPSQPAAAASNGQLVWTWNCPLDGGAAISHFVFQWRQQGGSFTTVTPNPTIPRYVLTGLPNGTIHEAQVVAVNAQGNSTPSSIGSGTPVASIPGGGNTLALRAETGDATREVDLSWLQPDTGGASITSYTYQWKSGGQSYSTGRQGSTSNRTATVTGLTNSISYDFRVRAANSVGSGPWSNEDSATPVSPLMPPPAETFPGPPTSLTGVPRRPLIVDWTWGVPLDDGGASIEDYDFQWRYQGDNWASANLTSGLISSSMSITLADATRGVQATGIS